MWGCSQSHEPKKLDITVFGVAVAEGVTLLSETRSRVRRRMENVGGIERDQVARVNAG